MNRIYSLFLAAILLALAASCSDSSSNPDDDTNLNMGTIVCKVDGSSWQSMSAYAADDDGITTILGVHNNLQTGLTQTLSISISGDIKTGTSNNVILALFSVANINNSSEITIYNSLTPVVNITYVSEGELRGKFSFTATAEGGEQKVISEGEFRVTVVR